jgi:hypothetical protein
MATKTTQFFSQRDEFLGILSEIVSLLGLEVILYSSGKRPTLEKIPGVTMIKAVKSSGVSWIYLAENPVDSQSIDAGLIEPARLGWIQIDLPREQGNILFLGECSIKTDWFDKESGTKVENPRSLKLYKRIVAEIRKHLASPVWAENIVTGGSSVYPDIGYTPSAKRFLEAGGQLMQEGVSNIRFRLSDNRTK